MPAVWNHMYRKYVFQGKFPISASRKINIFGIHFYHINDIHVRIWCKNILIIQNITIDLVDKTQQVKIKYNLILNTNSVPITYEPAR